MSLKEPTFDDVAAPEPQPPQWLSELAQLATQAFHSPIELAPIGCHFHKNEENEIPQWEITLFVSSTEIFGGPFDGQREISRFMVDLKDLMAVFDIVESCYWQAQAMADDDQLGPHAGIEGLFHGHSVWLRITSEPPSEFQPGRTFDQIASKLKNRW